MFVLAVVPWHWGTFATGIIVGMAVAMALRIIESIFPSGDQCFYVLNLRKRELTFTFDKKRDAERYANGSAHTTKDEHVVAEGLTWFDGQEGDHDKGRGLDES